MTRLAALITAGAWFLLAAGAVFAQEPDEDELLDEFALLDLQAEVSSAARYAQPLARSPSAISVLTHQDIEASGARRLPEVLRLVPGMDVYMLTPIWYGVGIRGNTTSASDSLLLLVDGRDATHEFLGAPLFGVHHFSMDEVERIEVIRGPGSSLYGANAYSGVINVITREPGQGPTAAASVRGGEHGAYEVSCSANAKIGDLSLGAGVGVVREDLWTGRDTLGVEILRGRLMGKIQLAPDSHLLLEAGALRTAGPFHSDMGTIDARAIYDLYSRVRLTHEDILVQAVYNRSSTESDLDANLYYNDFVLAEIPPLEASVDKVGVLAQHSLDFFHNLLIYGAEYVFNGYHSDVFLEPDQNEHRVGVFLQDELHVSGLLEELAGAEMPDLYLTAGLRFDYNSVTDWELSPRAAVVLTPDANNSFRFGYAHAFLKPTFLESSLDIRLLDVSNLGFDHLNISNPDLDNQTIDSLELGYAGSFLDGQLQVRLDLAYNWYLKLIRFHFNPDEMGHKEIGGSLIPDLDNLGMKFKNQSKGEEGHNIELLVAVKPTDRSRVFVTAGYRQVFDTGGTHLSSAEPSIRVGTGADIQTASGWFAAVQFFYTSQSEHGIDDPDSLLEPSTDVLISDSFLLNARVARELDAGSLKLTVGLEGFNLLGKRYREYSGIPRPNGPDYGHERLNRRVILFLRSEI